MIFETRIILGGIEYHNVQKADGLQDLQIRKFNLGFVTNTFFANYECSLKAKRYFHFLPFLAPFAGFAGGASPTVMLKTREY